MVCAGLGLVLGFVVAVARRYGPRCVDRLLFVPVEIIRGTPFLVQVFLLYYGGPFIGLRSTTCRPGCSRLTIYAAAYYTELLRAGFEAVPQGPCRGGRLRRPHRAQTLLRILLPEMTMLVLPAMVNMAILMLKETAILSIITVPELTLTVSAIGTQYYAFVESFTVLALIYWALVELCGAARPLSPSAASPSTASHDHVPARRRPRQRPDQDLRQDRACSTGSIWSRAARQGDLPHRPVGLGQEHAAALHRVSRGGDRRRSSRSTAQPLGFAPRPVGRAHAPAAAAHPRRCAATSAWCSSSSTSGRT